MSRVNIRGIEWELRRLKNEPISQSSLREILKYDSKTGNFIWLNRPNKNSPVKLGSVANKLHTSSGYHRIQIGGRRYQAHRLAWLYVLGEFPIGYIDHVDNNRGNNSISNLRMANGKNSTNSSLRCDSSTKIKGVSYHKASNKFCARVQSDKICYNLGLFEYLEDAANAVINKRKELHMEYSNNG